MGYIGRPNDSIFDDIKKIADAVAGEESSYDGTKDILRRSLERIADALENGGGGGGGVFVISASVDDMTMTLDKTYSEIKQAAIAGNICLINSVEIAKNGGEVIIDVLFVNSVQDAIPGVAVYTVDGVYLGTDPEQVTFGAESEDDYPTLEF